MQNDFLNIKEGKNGHGRYISSLLISLVSFLIVGSIIYIIGIFALNVYKPDSIDMTTFLPINGTLNLYLSMTVNIAWILGTWFAVRVIHKRKLKTLITPNEKINWKKILFGFGIFFALMGVMLGVELLLNPDEYEFNIFSWREYIWLVVAAIVLVPIQTTSEELFFRGLLLQWLGKFTKKPIVLALIAGGLFGVVHFWNPEMSYGWIVGLDYLFVGFMWTYITAKTNSLELSIGAHAANNMFLCLFLTMDDSVMGNIPSMFMSTELNPYISFMWSALTLIVFFIVTIRYHEKPQPTSSAPVEEKEEGNVSA